MQAEAMAAYSRSILEPVVALVQQQEATIREQAETIGTLRSERDTARAEVKTLKASQAQQGSNPGPVVPEATTDAPVSLTARLRALAPWVVSLLAIVAVIMLLVMPR